MMAEFGAWLFVSLQKLLPKHLLTAIVFHVARIRIKPVKNGLIRSFVWLYDVPLDEVQEAVPAGFDNFNDFFVRQLAAGARPIDESTNSIVSPVDGTVSEAGRISHGQILQAKGLSYSLADLLAINVADADDFTDGLFATVYLAPYNYHRVHCPQEAVIDSASYIPGDLYSVNRSTVDGLPGLFARNERLVCRFSSAAGPMVLVFVGALNVGSITTPWTGQIRPRRRGHPFDIDLAVAGKSTQVARGDLLGWFNMGSTVIVLLPRNSGRWHDDLVAGKTVRMGASIGRLHSP